MKLESVAQRYTVSFSLTKREWQLFARRTDAMAGSGVQILGCTADGSRIVSVDVSAENQESASFLAADVVRGLMRS